MYMQEKKAVKICIIGPCDNIIFSIGIVSMIFSIIPLNVYTCTCRCNNYYTSRYIRVLMRDEKEERKKQARSNKQTTLHSRQSALPLSYMYV